MAREVQVIARIEPALNRKLDAAKQATGMSKKAILRKAITEWLERQRTERAAGG